MVGNKSILRGPQRAKPTQGYVRKKPEARPAVIAKQPAVVVKRERKRLPEDEEMVTSNNQFSENTKSPHHNPPIGDLGVMGKNLDEDVKQIVEAWKRLPQQKRKHCLAVMSLDLQKVPDEDDRDVSMWTEAVFEALSAVLGPSDGPSHGPQVIRRLVGASSAWTPFAEFMQQARLHQLKPAERFAVFRLLAKLLVQRSRRVAQRADIPLSAKLVAQNVQHIAGIFDNAFPGYLQNGLVGSVSRMLVANPAAAARVMVD